MSSRRKRSVTFVWKKITKGQFLVFKVPCCGHYTYTDCFKTWASHTKSTVHCAYCRTIYQYEDTCFLCLQEHTEKLSCTMCCHTKVHSKCTTDLTALLLLLNFDHSLECGQLTNLTDCNRLQVHV